jgi:Coenzyme PQQ synthesis protein D (PqqD)
MFNSIKVRTFGHLLLCDMFFASRSAARRESLGQLALRHVIVREVRDTLLEEYDVEAERCEKDLIALLQELAKNDLIDLVDNV